MLSPKPDIQHFEHHVVYMMIVAFVFLRRLHSIMKLTVKLSLVNFVVLKVTEI
jgi:hypothetical protein